MSEQTRHKTNIHETSYERDQVVQIINSVLEKARMADDASREALFFELKGLKDIIEEAKHEISRVGPAEISATHIPTATDELDAVVGATEEATGAIMDACDVIQEKCAATDPEVRTVIEAEIIKIFEACSFQDITGQRITKVVKTLKQIEEKVEAVLKVVGGPLPGADLCGDGGTEEAVSLLNGPQLPANAIKQAEIDKLLAAFDKS